MQKTPSKSKRPDLSFEHIYLLETRLKGAFQDPAASAKASDPEVLRICRFAGAKAAGKYQAFSSRTGLEAEDYQSIALSFAVLFFHRYAKNLHGKKATHNALLRFLGQKLHRTMVRFGNKMGRNGVVYDEAIVEVAPKNAPEVSLDDLIQDYQAVITPKSRKKLQERAQNVLKSRITEDFSIRNLALETLYPIGATNMTKYDKNIYFAALSTVTGLGRLLNIELAAAQAMYNEGSQPRSEAHYDRVKSILLDLVRVVEESDNENSAKNQALGLPNPDSVVLPKN